MKAKKNSALVKQFRLQDIVVTKKLQKHLFSCFHYGSLLTDVDTIKKLSDIFFLDMTFLYKRKKDGERKN